MFVEMDHPKAGKLTVTGSHIKLTGTPCSVRTPSPALGEHTEELFGELLDLTPEEVEVLRKEGAI